MELAKVPSDQENAAFAVDFFKAVKNRAGELDNEATAATKAASAGADTQKNETVLGKEKRADAAQK
jgi:hypothetical protein